MFEIQFHWFKVLSDCGVFDYSMEWFKFCGQSLFEVNYHSKLLLCACVIGNEIEFLMWVFNVLYLKLLDFFNTSLGYNLQPFDGVDFDNSDEGPTIHVWYQNLSISILSILVSKWLYWSCDHLFDDVAAFGGHSKRKMSNLIIWERAKST